ncbi:MAG: FKBP-type peptidyl-prolyl cis-trans isomerase, partial [Bacteroidota bacterium]
MTLKNSLYCLLCLCFLACNEPSPEQPGVAITPQEAANANEVITNYTVHLIAHPQTQAERDQNIIVGYAMDHALELKRSLSGMYYQIIEPGTGIAPTAVSKVSAHYEGRLLDGTIFDSSYQRGTP